MNCEIMRRRKVYIGLSTTIIQRKELNQMTEENNEMDLSVLFDDMCIICDGWYTSNRYMYLEAEV